MQNGSKGELHALDRPKESFIPFETQHLCLRIYSFTYYDLFTQRERPALLVICRCPDFVTPQALEKLKNAQGNPNRIFYAYLYHTDGPTPTEPITNGYVSQYDIHRLQLEQSNGHHTHSDQTNGHRTLAIVNFNKSRINKGPNPPNTGIRFIREISNLKLEKDSNPATPVV